MKLPKPLRIVLAVLIVFAFSYGGAGLGSQLTQDGPASPHNLSGLKGFVIGGFVGLIGGVTLGAFIARWGE